MKARIVQGQNGTKRPRPQSTRYDSYAGMIQIRYMGRGRDPPLSPSFGTPRCQGLRDSSCLGLSREFLCDKGRSDRSVPFRCPEGQPHDNKRIGKRGSGLSCYSAPRTFTQKFIIICAIWARVAVPAGSRIRVPSAAVVPPMTPAPTAHCIAGAAYSWTCAPSG